MTGSARTYAILLAAVIVVGILAATGITVLLTEDADEPVSTIHAERTLPATAASGESIRATLNLSTDQPHERLVLRTMASDGMTAKTRNITLTNVDDGQFYYTIHLPETNRGTVFITEEFIGVDSTFEGDRIIRIDHGDGT